MVRLGGRARPVCHLHARILAHAHGGAPAKEVQARTMKMRRPAIFHERLMHGEQAMTRIFRMQ